MKKLFSIALVAIFAFAMNAKAQNQLIATLNHEGTVTVFYGADAFANAHGAATHGDVITLSPGKFKSTNITKAITIQGAGITTKIDSVSQIEPTIIQGRLDVTIADSITQQLKIEGIYYDNVFYVLNLKSPQFHKCRFSNFWVDVKVGKLSDATFVQCRFSDDIVFYPPCSATFCNCVIAEIEQRDSPAAPCTFVNCYMFTPDVTYSEYRNCVIYYDGSINSHLGNSTSNYYNNLLVAYRNDQYLDNRNNTYNRTIKSTSVPNIPGGYSDANTYELTEELKALMKGTDGTEVGIYGGLFPYDPVPNIPQITKFKVANKSTADGKLKVEVEVKGAE